MKNITSQFLYTVVLYLSLSLLQSAQAGTVKIEWQDPNSYTDIRHGNSHKTKFRKTLFSQLEQHLDKLVAKLPQELTLKIKVTNLNLAGDVRYNFAMHQDIRIVQHMYWPSIEFEYQLMSDEQIIHSESVKLKDMGFMDGGGRSRLNHGSYYYEKRILTDWFDKHLQVMVTEWQQQQVPSIRE